ncbi:MAG: hypothetical protein JWO82_898 [Akkermansiaceae bacterium]|nr:hypothetical protein [Akkermansiaceae bacterium]
MGRRGFVVKMVILLALVWGAVWGVIHWADSKRLTAAAVAGKIAAANFEDWSGYSQAPDAAAAGRRDKKIREIAGMVNRLDFAERQKSREDRTPEQFFRKLSGPEKKEFIDLTVRESMGKFMEVLDKQSPADRRKFVEDALKEIRQGKTADDMARAQDLGEDVLNTIANEGMRAYFEKASTDTKLDLAPLMESMNNVMQGLQQKEIMPGAR